MQESAIYRQGDILLVQIGGLPMTARLEDGDRCILAYGEATGHSHEVPDHGKIWVDVNNRSRRYLQILEDTVLTHQEHGEIQLKGPMVYEIIRQREYGALRTVQD